MKTKPPHKPASCWCLVCVELWTYCACVPSTPPFQIGGRRFFNQTYLHKGMTFQCVWLYCPYKDGNIAREQGARLWLPWRVEECKQRGGACVLLWRPDAPSVHLVYYVERVLRPGTFKEPTPVHSVLVLTLEKTDVRQHVSSAQRKKYKCIFLSLTLYLHYRSKVWGQPDNFRSSSQVFSCANIIA